MGHLSRLQHHEYERKYTAGARTAPCAFSCGGFVPSPTVYSSHVATSRAWRARIFWLFGFFCCFWLGASSSSSPAGQHAHASVHDVHAHDADAALCHAPSLPLHGSFRPPWNACLVVRGWRRGQAEGCLHGSLLLLLGLFLGSLGLSPTLYFPPARPQGFAPGRRGVLALPPGHPQPGHRDHYFAAKDSR